MIEIRDVDGNVLRTINANTLSHADLSYANLSHANLSGANLSGANLSHADLSYASLSGANLSGADLSGADLSGANLSGADLSHADLSYASLSYVNLSGANLSGATLSGADLSYASLSYVNLSGADLSGVNLFRADLSGANLSHVDLSGANLSGAIGYSKYQLSPLHMLRDQPGKIRAYKLVKENGGGPYNGGIIFKIGETYCDKDANTNEFVECGAGINLATLDWVMREWEPGFKILIAEFTAKDIAAIPITTDGKFRVFRCKIVGKKNLKELGLKG